MLSVPGYNKFQDAGHIVGKPCQSIFWHPGPIAKKQLMWGWSTAGNRMDVVNMDHSEHQIVWGGLGTWGGLAGKVKAQKVAKFLGSSD